MTIEFKSFLAAHAIALGIGCAAIIPAQAFEPSGNDIADAFLALLEAEDGTVESYGTVDAAGNVVSIDAIKLVEDGGDQVSVTLGRTELTDASTLTNGRLSVGKFTITNLDMVAEDGALSIGSFHANDLILPSVEEISADAEPPVAPSYRDLQILDTTVSDETGNTARIERIFVAIDGMDGDLPTASRFSLENLIVDVASLDEETGKALTDLGYEKVTLSVDGAANWDPNTGIATLEPVKISGPEVGTFQMSVRLGGVTRDVIAQLNDAQGDPESALGLLQGVSIEAISLRIDNDSLVERVLDRQAREAGTDRAGIVGQIETGLPFMLGILQNPEFQAQVAASVTSFLRDPQSLTVTASPGTPVPVSQIMGTVMLAPQTLPQVLGIAITAND